jgi:asparagine synthase (glutamine-hydrolysing)
MCGICGIVFSNKNREVNPSVLNNMTDVLQHRGPDDKGSYFKANIGLGFRRLSIIDLYSGHQPIVNEDEGTVIVFNGEIYNYLEIRNQLKKQGFIFKTDTDTEVILHAYEAYGVKCLDVLRGMFAFAIWDNKKNQLFCARDRFGIKPFFYYFDNHQFVFGSEIKAILEASDIDKTISYEGLDSFFAFGYITSNYSIYKNINKLLPSYYLIYSPYEKESLKIEQYWQIEFKPDYSKTDSQWIEEINEAFSESIKSHMISDVPLGAFLSGGIDSSSVVAFMAKHSNIPVKTFSIGFKEKKYNELNFARTIANKYNCEHHELVIEPESIDLLPKLVHGCDEPFADPSILPTYHVSRFAREYVTVSLSGDGGDELFAGYNIYYSLYKLYQSPLYFDSDLLNKVIWGSLHNIIPTNKRGKSKSYLLSKNKNLLGAYQLLWPEPLRKQLQLHYHQYGTPFPASENYKVELLNKNNDYDFITNLQYLDLKTYMVDDILTKVDRASMLSSLEVRVPLLDHKLAELSFTIPSGLKIRGSDSKFIYKQAMKEYLPPDVINHPKQGFGIPLSEWFKEDLNTYVFETLRSPNSLYSKYLDKKPVLNLLANTPAHKIESQSRQLWSLIVFEEWLKQYNL